MSTTPHIELNATSPDAIDGRQIRAVVFEEVRLEYVRRTLHRLGIDATGRRALVVGGGRGILPRGLARLGFEVLAVDPSKVATEVAREMAEREGLQIVHETAPAEEPGVEQKAFDVAYYADTFEITSQLGRVVDQAARALKPDGVLFYDTVNRTLPARLVYLGAFQGFPMTRIMPSGRYAAERLRTPRELAEVLEHNGLHNEDVCDFKPRTLSGLVKAALRRRRGTITDAEMPSLADFMLNPKGRPVVTYLGYARRL
jgi:2-polyprenyl-6-hydroxyphenyl methylase/3-demethylubiquinone-9 3-methyltransferase